MINKKILATTFLVRIIMMVSSFGLLIISSRFLGAEGRGIISLYVVNVTIVQLISEIIFGPGYIYNAQRIPFRKLFIAGLIWSFLSSIIIPAILFLSHIQSPDILPFLIINSFLFSVITGINYQLQALHYSSAFNFINMLQAISSLGIVWIFLKEESSVQLFCSALTYSYILTCIAGIYFLRKYYKNNLIKSTPLFHNSLAQSFRIGLTAQYSNFLNFMNTRIGFYLIFIILGNIKELGVFAAAATLAESVWIISNTLATWLYPQIASSADQKEMINKTLSNAYSAFWYSFFSLSILLFIPEKLFLLILGNDFTGIKNYIVFLIPGTLLLAYGKIFWNYFSGTGQFNINNYASFISTIIAIISSIPLMYYFNINGIAISTSIGYIIYTIILITVFIQKNRLSIRTVLPSFKLFPW